MRCYVACLAVVPFACLSVKGTSKRNGQCLSTSIQQVQPQKRTRDQRLDLARGVMLLIIFIAHVPNNPLADYIPARFGFSSGAEIFVFCSGIASGLAFGRSYLSKGFGEGSKRIAKRIMQLYTAHIGTLLVLGTAAFAVDYLLNNSIMAERYSLELLREAPLTSFLKYMTLQYVPAFFDILPMYVVILALVIPMMALAQISRFIMMGTAAALWIIIQIAPVNFSGNPITGAQWYFNPFAWQFLFFIGFSFGIGWLKPPQRNIPWLLWTSIVVLVISVPLNFWGFWSAFPAVDHLNTLIYPPDAITQLHYTRLVHFLALAYVAYSLVDPVAEWLSDRRLTPLLRIGRNSFPCFLIGLGLSMAGGVAFDIYGMGFLASAVINLGGVMALVWIAQGLEVFARFRANQSKHPIKFPAVTSTIPNDGREPGHIA
jgi:hypothetical protein